MKKWHGQHWLRYCKIWLKHAWHNGTIWYAVALLLLLPVWFKPQFLMPSTVVDTLFVIDVSESMNVPDVHYPRPNIPRIVLAKAAVKAGMASLPCGSRVSVGLFAGEETVVLFEPLEICRHYPAIEQVVSKLNTQMRWIGDSWVVRGLISGIKEAKKRELNLVMVTDADEMPHRETPRIADLLPYQGKVNAVLWGVGGSTPQPVPKVDGQGNMIAYWTPEDAVIEGNYPNLLAYVKYLKKGEQAPAGVLDEVSEHLSAFNRPMMQSVADVLKVSYHVLQAPQDGLPSLSTAVFQKQSVAPRDARWIFGLAALASVLIAWFWQPLYSRFLK